MKTKKKYEAKTGEEWLQHAARYLYCTYHCSECYAGWSSKEEQEAYRIIVSLIKKVGDA